MPLCFQRLYRPGTMTDGLQHPATCALFDGIKQMEVSKISPKKYAVWVLLLMCFALEVSHLFHTQTPSNWIVNLWWRLIIRPSSEVLMRSYFSWLTSPQITSGDSSFWVWMRFRVSVRLAGGIKMSCWCFAGPVSGFRLEKTNVPIHKFGKPLYIFFRHLTTYKFVYRLKESFHNVSKYIISGNSAWVCFSDTMWYCYVCNVAIKCHFGLTWWINL